MGLWPLEGVSPCEWWPWEGHRSTNTSQSWYLDGHYSLFLQMLGMKRRILSAPLWDKWEIVLILQSHTDCLSKPSGQVKA